MENGVGPFTRLEEQFLPAESMEQHAAGFKASQKKCSGIVQFSSGNFLFTPQGGNKSWFGAAAKPLQVSGDAIVGVVKTGPYSFQLWYCPVTSSKGGEVKRKLVKTADFVLEQGAGADAFGGAAKGLDALVTEIRQTCCWWGRKVAPRVVVIVNPTSGKGKSVQNLQQVVLPVLQDAAGLAVQVHHTQRPKHAEELAQGLAPGSVDLLVVLGGDGTAYEAVQGLFQRQDWEAASKIPIAVIPTGSGNGLAASTGMWCPATACHAICKGFISPLDIASVLQAPNQRHFMFLSVTYGLMSNLDEGTNHLRWMGELRFVYGMLRELLKGKAYKARITYLPAGATSPQPDDASVHAEDESRPENCEAGRLLTHYGAGPACRHLAQLGFLPAHVPDSSISTPPAPGWKVMGETGLQYFGIYSPEYVALDFKPNPQGGVSTGNLDLHWMDGGNMSFRRRLQGLGAFLQTTSGVVADVITTAKVLALIIEPLDGGTWMMVDGEVVQNKILYVEVHPGLGRVLVAPGLGGQQRVGEV